MKVVIVDYGMGNLRSVEKALEKVGVNSLISASAEDIFSADAVVVPGVGAFGDAMNELTRLDLVSPLRQRVLDNIPVLGICLGLQVFFESSEEAPGVSGLGFVRGTVRRFPADCGLKIPHMGWNSLTICKNSQLFGGVRDGAHVYFVHSYYVEPTDPKVVAATSEYGLSFCAAIEHQNLFGVQFHPEKSQTVGLTILSNFARILQKS
ncbi:MAG: imidazole glycerol phosphate synthase subunit HisH [Candidatus Sumerlaeaceae bacterium]|jgi:glutamine amidotransferase